MIVLGIIIIVFGWNLISMIYIFNRLANALNRDANEYENSS